MNFDNQVLIIHDRKNWTAVEDLLMINKRSYPIPSVMIRTAEWTDKDFVCLANCLADWRFRIVQREEAANNCYSCQYRMDCDIGYYRDLFEKLYRVTGINIMEKYISHETKKAQIYRLATVGGIELTSKDFACYTQLLESWHKSSTQQIAWNPCTTCPYKNGCRGNISTGDWAEALIKLSHITGVNCISETRVNKRHGDRERMAATLPMGSNLLDRDYQCLARRLQEFIRIVIFGENRQVLLSNCSECAYSEKCYSGQVWDSFYRLSKTTGVFMSVFCRSDGKGMTIPYGDFSRTDAAPPVRIQLDQREIEPVLNKIALELARGELTDREAFEKVKDSFHLISPIIVRSEDSPKPY